MLGRSILTWMTEEDRTIGYVSRASDIDPGRLVDVLSGKARPTDVELNGLSRATGLPVEDLQTEAQAADVGVSTDPLRCYTVAEAALIMHVSQDTVRKEAREGTLAHVILGERALRIPRLALERRLGQAEDPHEEKRAVRRPRRPLSDAPTAPQRSLL